MNYQHHYNLLIERQKNRLLEGYKERHHIVPRCLGGKDLPENLVDLTAREHFVQHQLLAKIYPENKGLQLAASMMSVSNQIHERTENRRYQWVRERHQKQMSELQAGEGNSQFGTKWIHKGTESKKVPKDSLKQWLDDGWELGRYTEQRYNECIACSIVFEVKTKELFCSEVCKKEHRFPLYKILRERPDEIIDLFSQTHNIQQVCRQYGLEGKQGNRIISTFLKENGFDIKRRR